MDNREILFRGKCTDTGRWYEGQYIHLHKTTYCFKEDYDRNPDNDIHQIVFEEMMDWGLPNRHLRADVLPETVGQYTGLTDKNGKKIFEGDIIKGCEYDDIYFVKYFADDNYPAFDVVPEMNTECNGLSHLIIVEGIEVIGNIHDNPELLKGGAE